MKDCDNEIIEEEITSPNISLKGKINFLSHDKLGIIWRALGKETYDKWMNYLAQGKNVNEILLCCKLYGKLLDDSFEYITETESDHLKKQGKQQSHTQPIQSKIIAPNGKVNRNIIF